MWVHLRGDEDILTWKWTLKVSKTLYLTRFNSLEGITNGIHTVEKRHHQDNGNIWNLVLSTGYFHYISVNDRVGDFRPQTFSIFAVPLCAASSDLEMGNFPRRKTKSIFVSSENVFKTTSPLQRCVCCLFSGKLFKLLWKSLKICCRLLRNALRGAKIEFSRLPFPVQNLNSHFVFRFLSVWKSRFKVLLVLSITQCTSQICCRQKMLNYIRCKSRCTFLMEIKHSLRSKAEFVNSNSFLRMPHKFLQHFLRKLMNFPR